MKQRSVRGRSHTRRALGGILFVLCLASRTTSAQSASSPRLEMPNLNKLSEAEKLEIFGCHQSLYLGQRCETLRDRVCAEAVNQSNWTCMTSRFDKCKVTDFAGSACQQALKGVCNDTRDQWDRACDKYRYELCLAKEFKDNILVGDEERSCKDVRFQFTLPTVEKSVLGIEKDALSRPFVTDGREISSTWKDGLCQMAGTDASHPLRAFCQTTQTPPLSFEAFFGAYRSLKRTSPTFAADKKKLFEQTLRVNADGDPAVLPSNNPWDPIGANSVWLEESEASDLELRRGGAKVLQKYGDDSFLSNFLLLRATQDDDNEVRLTGFRGLASRSYRSGLVMTVLLQAMEDPEPEVRSLGFEGVARRWNSEAQGGYANAVGRPLAGLFPCPTTLSTGDIRPIADAPSVDDLRRLKPVDYFCSFGVGVNLVRFRATIFQEYVQAARSSASPVEKASALRGLRLLAAESDKPLLIDLARGALSDASSLVRRAALSLYGKAAYNTTPVYTAMKAEINRMLFTERNTPRKDLVELFGLLIEQKRTMTNPIPTMPYDAGNALPIYTQCVSTATLPIELRNWCFDRGSAPYPFPDYNLEQAYYPVFQLVITQGTHGEIEQAIGFFLNGQFRFRVDTTNNNTDQRKALVALVSERLDAEFAKLTFDQASGHVATLMRLLTSLDPVASEILMGDLRDRRGVRGFVENALRTKAPVLPMPSWYARFKDTKQDVIERADIEVTNPLTGVVQHFHEYKTRKWIEDAILCTYATCNATSVPLSSKRSLADIAFAEYDGLEEQFFALYKAWQDDPTLDKKLEFWGVTDAPAEPTH